jgi:N-acetyl-gamma-glutamyl-phosphate reductase
VALVGPLVRNGLLSCDVALTAFSLTGYSGGGKKMIADYEDARTALHLGGRQYAMAQKHKHLPEMLKVCGISVAPAFCPVVVPHYSGMEVTVPVFAKDLRCSPEAVKELYREYYAEGLVRYADAPDEEGFLSSAKLSGKDTMEVSVYGNDERILLVSRFDNLGKGASGAAIQNMNIVIGADEACGLSV